MGTGKIGSALVAGAFGLAMLAAGSAQAAGYADYENVFTITTTHDVDGIAVYAQPAAGTDISGSAISYGSNYAAPAGASAFTYRPYFFGDVPASTPTVSTLYGLSTLDPEVSIFDISDVTALHFVIGLSNGFAISILGDSFSDAFSGFTSTAYEDPLDEQNFIDELLYVFGLDQQYGLPASGFDGPQTNLLFDFGSYLNAQGASLTSGGTFQMVAFSSATSIGTGTVTQNDLTGAIPEPATWALLIGGFGLAGAALRRQRAAVAA